MKCTFVCACGKIEKQQIYVLRLSLELLKVGGHGFPDPYDGPHNHHLIFKLPSVDTVFDMPASHGNKPSHCGLYVYH
jgi:hypothetical protein